MALDQDSIKNYLADMHGADVSEVNGDTLLFSSGLVDSFAMIDLVTYIETQTGASMGAADITLDNLDSIDRIVAFVQSKAA